MKSSILRLLVTLVLGGVPAIAAEVDVYLLGGQSNMEGQGDIGDLTEAQKQFSNKVSFWNGTQFEPLVVGKTMTSNRPERFGLELSFAQKLAKGGGPIYLVKFSASGMPLHHGWDRNTWKGGKEATTEQAIVDRSMSYGYFWWLPNLTEDGNPCPTTMAFGAGGQVIYVVSKYEPVVVFTSGKVYEHKVLRSLLQDKIIPAFRPQTTN